MGDDPTKDPEFNRVVDHFLTTKPKQREPTKAKPGRKERPASKGRVRKGKSRS
jgi:hypothetical protein